MNKRKETEDRLAALLSLIETNDLNYDIRNSYVIEAVLCARLLGYPAGFQIDDKEPDWPVALIALPTGQVSWHLPKFADPWDGHDTPEKYRRCRAFTAMVSEE